MSLKWNNENDNENKNENELIQILGILATRIRKNSVYYIFVFEGVIIVQCNNFIMYIY